MDARQLYQVYFTGKVPHFCSESEAMDTNGFFSVEHWPLENYLTLTHPNFKTLLTFFWYFPSFFSSLEIKKNSKEKLLSSGSLSL
jgi:hypothetical protein